MGRLQLPISDYITDTKTALDNSLRVLQALVDAAGDAGYLTTALSTMALVQSLMQVSTTMHQYLACFFSFRSETSEIRRHWISIPLSGSFRVGGHIVDAAFSGIVLNVLYVSQQYLTRQGRLFGRVKIVLGMVSLL